MRGRRCLASGRVSRVGLDVPHDDGMSSTLDSPTRCVGANLPTPLDPVLGDPGSARPSAAADRIMAALAAAWTAARALASAPQPTYDAYLPSTARRDLLRGRRRDALPYSTPAALDSTYALPLILGRLVTQDRADSATRPPHRRALTPCGHESGADADRPRDGPLPRDLRAYALGSRLAEAVPVRS